MGLRPRLYHSRIFDIPSLFLLRISEAVQQEVLRLIPQDMLDWIPIAPRPASRAGKAFRGAGGERIPAKGRRTMVAKTMEGHTRRITWEVCPIKRPLLSATKIAKSGNIVQIGETEAFIKNVATGQTIMLRRERNIWLLDLWVQKPPDQKPVFARPVLGE